MSNPLYVRLISCVLSIASYFITVPAIGQDACLIERPSHFQLCDTRQFNSESLLPWAFDRHRMLYPSLGSSPFRACAKDNPLRPCANLKFVKSPILENLHVFIDKDIVFTFPDELSDLAIISFLAESLTFRKSELRCLPVRFTENLTVDETRVVAWSVPQWKNQAYIISGPRELDRTSPRIRNQVHQCTEVIELNHVGLASLNLNSRSAYARKRAADAIQNWLKPKAVDQNIRWHHWSPQPFSEESLFLSPNLRPAILSGIAEIGSETIAIRLDCSENCHLYLSLADDGLHTRGE